MTVRGWLVAPVLLVSLACAGRTPAVVSKYPDSRAAADGERSEFPSQRIFRVRYQGDAGTAGFRLIARLTSPSVYRLSATDSVGRRLWTLDYDSPTSRFIDHRAGRACTTDRAVALSEAPLRMLALSDLALVLVGRPPRSARTVADASAVREATERGQRSLTFQRSESGIDSWTMWSEGRPVLWYRKDAQGSVLSHSDGSQIRWKETRREKLLDRPGSLAIPEGLVIVACDELGNGAAPGESRNPPPPSG